MTENKTPDLDAPAEEIAEALYSAAPYARDLNDTRRLVRQAVVDNDLALLQSEYEDAELLEAEWHELARWFDEAREMFVEDAEVPPPACQWFKCERCSEIVPEDQVDWTTGAHKGTCGGRATEEVLAPDYRDERIAELEARVERLEQLLSSDVDDSESRLAKIEDRLSDVEYAQRPDDDY